MRKIFYSLFVFLIWLPSARVTAQIGFPYCESFQTASTQGRTIIGGNAQLVLGAGVLRLTNTLNNQRGFVYIDVPFPSTYGLKAEFEYFSYGSNNQGDGFTAFLFDGDTPVFNAGGYGGSLGYAPRNQEPGLSNAYLGIGFDEYGNFGTSQESRTGSFTTLDQNGRAPDAIVLRGPSSRSYPFVVGRRTNEVGPAKNGLNLGDQFTLSSGGLGTTRVTDRNKLGYRKVFLELQPNLNGPGFFLKLRMEVTTEPNKPRIVTIFDGAYQFLAPKNLKIGFAGSTGGATNFHEIRNLIVQVAADGALQDPEGIDIRDFSSCAGQKNQFYITDEEVRLPNENSTIRCLQFYKSLDEIKIENSDICSQARCLEENRTKYFPEGVFEATDQAGGFTFLPNKDFIDKEVTVYYTITDNYGKTSKGNSITLLIKESPDPISLRADGQVGNPQEVVICQGDTLSLGGEGNEEYTRFEWKKDGVLVGGATQSKLLVSDKGVYEIIGYNRKNCPAISNALKVKWVEYPALKLSRPVVGCTIGQSLDIGSFINGFDAQRFDYRFVGEGLDLENEELKKVSTSGKFELQVKPKGIACYSSPVAVEVYIQEKELEVAFEFEVEGTGIKDDATGGIFPDDVIQFTDLSEERIVKWKWDFGDETSSSEKEPSHTYGKKGKFEVVLIAIDRYGCQSQFTKTVQITKSYRLMVPNAFTPQQDANKSFMPKFKGLVSLELSIFNSWGELIYRNSDLEQEGWDGTVSGTLQEAGFYFYSLVGKSTDGEKVESNGKFRLIR